MKQLRLRQTRSWTVCQIGAREHYGLARALHRKGLLGELVTDVWVTPGRAFNRLPGVLGLRLRGRYAPSLVSARVRHFTMSTLWASSLERLGRESTGWRRVMMQNQLFQQLAAKHLRRGNRRESPPHFVFAYSYAALEILKVAKELGATTILGQIDGGSADEAHIRSVTAMKQDFGLVGAMPAPAEYWEAWREETRIADRIVVNSTWARDLLIRAGVSQHKLVEIPPVYEPQAGERVIRRWCHHFSALRPLTVLFLGTLSLRKGILEVLEAAALLRKEPVRFILVGPDLSGVSRVASKYPNVVLIGAVPRSEVGRFYADADVFLFPSHSDGFGTTQTEAQDHGLPIIASRFCGSVVSHRVNGLLLDEVSGESIMNALRFLLANPSALEAMSERALERRSDYLPEKVLPDLIDAAESARQVDGESFS